MQGSVQSAMIVRARPHAFALLFTLRGSILPVIAPKLLVVLLVSGGVTWAYQRSPHLFHQITWTPFSLLGIALSVFLAFRNSAAYERWWEGRRQWGQLLAESRVFARETAALIDDAPCRSQLARRLIAFAHALKAHLSGDDSGAWAEWLAPEERARVAGARNRPDQILLAQSADLSALLRRGALDMVQFGRLSDRLAAMAAVQAACERIGSTPAPFTYTLLLHRTAWLFCLLLPFGLAGALGWATPVAAMILGYAFFGLDALCEELEAPFGSAQNALPLDALVRNIEIAVLDAAGSLDSPQPHGTGRDGACVPVTSAAE